ncbi:MAG: triose-phosphate isomerase [Candidatus Babeliales bacterium]|nr:triose-phosphate isomerase [Candidatus Babeliales bacterium]
MTHQRIYVANWKMNMHLGDAVDFAKQCKSFIQKNENLKKQIILCPSFPAITSVALALEDTAIGVSAQNCSDHQVGAYTGEVSAQSLREAGCSYCIVGHSERRKYFHETNEIIARKVTNLLRAAINPIICIGETAQELKDDKTLSVLEEQLILIVKAINESQETPESICIAYEPVWAIGTGKVPDQEALTKVFTWLAAYIKKELTNCPTVHLLYGGSVDENSIVQLTSATNIDGFLIGSASLDFQKFKNIVSLL